MSFSPIVPVVVITPPVSPEAVAVIEVTVPCCEAHVWVGDVLFEIVKFAIP